MKKSKCLICSKLKDDVLHIVPILPEGEGLSVVCRDCFKFLRTLRSVFSECSDYCTNQKSV